MISRTSGADGESVRRQPAKVRPAFWRIRDAAAHGDPWARGRLRQHVLKRRRAGWGWLSIAKRLGLRVDDTVRLAAVSDLTPRLVRRAPAGDASAVPGLPADALRAGLGRRATAEGDDE